MTGVWRHAVEVAYVESEERVALLDLDRLDELPVVLTDSGAAIWLAVDGRRTDERIVSAVAEGFGAEVDQIAAQVRAFLQDLASRRLISRA